MGHMLLPDDSGAARGTPDRMGHLWDNWDMRSLFSEWGHNGDNGDILLPGGPGRGSFHLLAGKRAMMINSVEGPL